MPMHKKSGMKKGGMMKKSGMKKGGMMKKSGMKSSMKKGGRSMTKMPPLKTKRKKASGTMKKKKMGY